MFTTTRPAVPRHEPSAVDAPSLRCTRRPHRRTRAATVALALLAGLATTGLAPWAARPAAAAAPACTLLIDRSEVGFVAADWTAPSGYVFDPTAPIGPTAASVTDGNHYLTTLDRVAPGGTYRFALVQFLACDTATPAVGDFSGSYWQVYVYYDYTQWDPYGFESLIDDVSGLPLTPQPGGDDLRVAVPTAVPPQVAPLTGIDGTFYFVRVVTWEIEIRSDAITTDPDDDPLWGFEVVNGAYWGEDVLGPDGNVLALRFHVADDPEDGPTVQQTSTGPTMSCSPAVFTVGARVTCTVSGGPADSDIVWRAAYNPTFAEGVMRTGADGTGTFSFVMPRGALGQAVSVELVGWSAPLAVGVAGGPIPGTVPAGEGERPLGVGLVVLLAGAAVASRGHVGRRQVVSG
jgi:hypothetical protein